MATDLVFGASASFLAFDSCLAFRFSGQVLSRSRATFLLSLLLVDECRDRLGLLRRESELLAIELDLEGAVRVAVDVLEHCLGLLD